MKGKHVSCIFPAFGAGFLGNEREIISNYSYNFDELLRISSEVVDIDFDYIKNYIDDLEGNELQAQYAAYIYSSAFSDILKKENFTTEYIAGYSMGLYAALYHADAITFEQGLLLINEAYKLIFNSTSNKKFTMGIIVGLDKNDVSNIISLCEDVEIINVNNKHSYVIAGLETEVNKALDMAKEEGALNIKKMPVSSPYHSEFMNKAADEFKNYVEGVDIMHPVSKIISTVDQRIITSKEDIKKDLVDNINTNINWMKTMTKMIILGEKKFIECGTGKSLLKMAKFIDGDFKIYTIDKLNKLNMVIT